jgi:hypothetical protein
MISQQASYQAFTYSSLPKIIHQSHFTIKHTTLATAKQDVAEVPSAITSPDFKLSNHLTHRNSILQAPSTHSARQSIS